VLDFTSSLYLGLRHASSDLRPWAQLTSGVPAALAEPRDASNVARELAGLVGTERAALSRSTLHAFWDLFPILADRHTAIYMDAATYPIARWGVERARCRGIPAATFRHHSPSELRRLLAQSRARMRPLIVTDGFCVGCGRFAPVGAYLALEREFGGMVVVDDTQALGVFGRTPTSVVPYGLGGGGSLRAKSLFDASIVLVSSLAKGFGVPMAIVAGSASSVARFKAGSMTNVHSSPPSFADLRAAERALRINHSSGEALRSRLAGLVRRFRCRMLAAGIGVANSVFPVQSLVFDEGMAHSLYRSLTSEGIRAVLHRPPCKHGAALSFIITASHTAAAIDRAVAATANEIEAAPSAAEPARAYV
jgi:8-amino-7-oxononanoate synthase